MAEDETIIQENKNRSKRSFKLEKRDQESPRALLVVLSGEDLGKVCLLGEDEIRIGRDGKCDFTLDDTRISKIHCALTTAEGYYFLEDLDSSNGTFVEGKRLKKKRLLTHFDRIILGDTVLRFFMEETL